MTFPMTFQPMFGGLLPVSPGQPFATSMAPVGGALPVISTACAAPSIRSIASQKVGGARANSKIRRHGSAKRESDRSEPRKVNGTGTSSSQSREGGHSAPRKVHVVMGIDFGTAFTKIVIRAPYEPDGMNTAYAVEFDKISGNPCMLHSAVWMDNVDDDKKKICWVDGQQGRKMYSGIKVDVIDPPHSSRPSNRALARAAAYLGIVIRGARTWFEKQQRFGENIDLDWNYHIGIPAATARCDLAREDYNRLANAALALSDLPKFSLWVAEREIEREQGSRVDWIPEVIAQAYGYARDPAFAEGVYAMVDVGAWTLDVCSFINQVVGTQLDLRAAIVKPLGCMNLHQARMDAVGRAIMPDQFNLLPQPKEYWQRIEKNNTAVINRADNAFRGECEEIVSGVLAVALQQQQLRRMIERGGLSVMICGGGSNIPLFKNAAGQGWDTALKMQQASTEAQFPSLPKYGLNGLGINEKNFHRFSVAWGLSYPDIDYRFNVSLPPPPQLRQSRYRDLYPGKEQM